MVPQEIVDHLLLFFTTGRLSKQKQIGPNEPDKDLINQASRLGLTVRITDKKKAGKTKGYRFTPVGRSFLTAYLQNQTLKEARGELFLQNEDLKRQLIEATSQIQKEPENLAAGVIEALEDIKRPAWNYLLTEVKDATAQKHLRRVLNELAALRRRTRSHERNVDEEDSTLHTG